MVLVRREFTNNMTTHMLNAAIKPMAREGMERQQPLNQERNAAWNVKVKRRVR